MMDYLFAVLIAIGFVLAYLAVGLLMMAIVFGGGYILLSDTARRVFRWAPTVALGCAAALFTVLPFFVESSVAQMGVSWGIGFMCAVFCAASSVEVQNQRKRIGCE